MLNHSKQHIETSILWNEIIQGNESAFHRLFIEQYRSLMIFGLGIKMDKALIEDMIQELFLELWKRRSSLPPVENLNAYLKQILKRKIFKSIQKGEKVHYLKFLNINDQVHPYESLLIQQESNQQLRFKLQNALNKLTQKQKEIIQLRFFNGLSYDEIAHQSGIQKRTIYNQVHSAILVLKKFMSKD